MNYQIWFSRRNYKSNIHLFSARLRTNMIWAQLDVSYQYSSRGTVKEENYMISLGLFSLVLHKSICCGYSLEAPH